MYRLGGKLREGEGFVVSNGVGFGKDDDGHTGYGVAACRPLYGSRIVESVAYRGACGCGGGGDAYFPELFSWKLPMAEVAKGWA